MCLDKNENFNLRILVKNSCYRCEGAHETIESQVGGCEEDDTEDPCAAADDVEKEQEDLAKVWYCAVLAVHVDGVEAGEETDGGEDGGEAEGDVVEPVRVWGQRVPHGFNSSYCRNCGAGETDENKKDFDQGLRSVLQDIVKPLRENQNASKSLFLATLNLPNLETCECCSHLISVHFSCLSPFAVNREINKINIISLPEHFKESFFLFPDIPSPSLHEVDNDSRPDRAEDEEENPKKDSSNQPCVPELRTQESVRPVE